jgi:hypothetical protein
MIQLIPSCLVLSSLDGIGEPFSIEEAIASHKPELNRDPELVSDLAAVLGYYFLEEKKKPLVPLEDFRAALDAMCRCLKVSSVPRKNYYSTDLLHLAEQSKPGFEIGFFHLLHEEVERHQKSSLSHIIFGRLREAVMAITGSRKWTCRCEALQDQIIAYIRSYFHKAPGPNRVLFIS